MVACVRCIQHIIIANASEEKEWYMDTLLVEDHGYVRILRLNRPEKRNALNAALCQRITAEVTKVAVLDDASVRAILLCGEGAAFCAGADLGSSRTEAGAAAKGGVYGGGFHDALFTMLWAIVACPVPVIADVQGPAVGAGTQLALACDLRVAGDAAWFGVPAAALGFALDSWTINRARELLGGAVARNMLIAHQRLVLSQAVATGFVVKHSDSAGALGFAQEVAALAPLAMRQLKQVLNERDDSYLLTPDQQELYHMCWASEDAAEAKQARIEKRAPQFQGK